MKIVEKDTTDKVRIIIGRAVYQKSGLHKPTKAILLTDTDVKEVYKKIIKFLEKENEGKN